MESDGEQDTTSSSEEEASGSGKPAAIKGKAEDIGKPSTTQSSEKTGEE